MGAKELGADVLVDAAFIDEQRKNAWLRRRTVVMSNGSMVLIRHQFNRHPMHVHRILRMIYQWHQR